MKEKLSGKLYTFYRILLFLLMALIVLITGIGLFTILRPAESGPLFKLGKAETDRTAAGNSAADSNDGISVFNGIGRLRIPVAGSNGSSAATLILSIAFPYPSSDQPFTEELASKISNLKTISAEYFSSLPASTFINFDEETAKKELLKLFNANLRLGKIETLYFNDLMIME